MMIALVTKSIYVVELCRLATVGLFLILGWIIFMCLYCIASRMLVEYPSTWKANRIMS